MLNISAAEAAAEIAYYIKKTMALASYQKSKRRGRGFVACIAGLAVLLMCIALAYSLTMRLYLRAYYCSAHAAGLSLLPFIFLIVQVRHGVLLFDLDLALDLGVYLMHGLLFIKLGK